MLHRGFTVVVSYVLSVTASLMVLEYSFDDRKPGTKPCVRPIQIFYADGDD